VRPSSIRSGIIDKFDWRISSPIEFAIVIGVFEDDDSIS